MTTINFTCPECGHSMQLSAALDGQNGKCPKCQKDVLVVGELGVASSLPQTMQPIPTQPQVPPQQVVQQPPPLSAPVQQPYQQTPQQPVAPIQQPQMLSQQQPHRGTLILVLGLVGLLTGIGFVLGPLAWFLGKGDLKKMEDGQMDTSGKDLTKIGYVFGQITTILYIVIAVVLVPIVTRSIFRGGGNEKIQIQSTETRAPLRVRLRAPGDTRMLLPGLVSPVMHEAEKANLSDTERVIGVTVGDKHRAYLTNAFDSLGAKVVNDLVDEVPISITYCDIHERARVFTSAERGSPLNMGLGGWQNQEMFFCYDGEEFQHSAEETPLPDYPYILTTWGEWKNTHPATQIYMGGGVIPKDNKSTEESLSDE